MIIECKKFKLWFFEWIHNLKAGFYQFIWYIFSQLHKLNIDQVSNKTRSVIELYKENLILSSKQ